MLKVSIVAPVYCGATSVRELHRRLSDVAASEVDARFEFVLVDDASPDASWEVISSLAAADRRVVGLRLTANVRQVRAIFAGTAVASGDVIVVMDADLDDPPEAIGHLLQAHRRGHDLVVVRRIRPRRDRARSTGTTAMAAVARACRLPTDDLGSSFLLMERHIEVEVRDVLERTGAQLLLPTNFAAARHPTVLDVEATATSPSGYRFSALARMGLSFLDVYLSGPIGRTLAGVGTTAIVAGTVAGPRYRLARLAGAASLAVGAALVVRAGRDRRDRSVPLYEVAERVGAGLSALDP